MFSIFRPLPAAPAEEEVPLKNPQFTQGAQADGFPVGWSLYAGKGTGLEIKVVDTEDGGKAVLLKDGDPAAEIGLTQTVPVKPRLVYEARVKIRGMEGASAMGAHIQLRFLPSNQYAQTSFGTENTRRFKEAAVKAVAPPDTTSAVIYLYTHREPTPSVLITDVRLVSGVDPPVGPPPPPVPPVYTKLKDLCLNTVLVKDGKPQVTLVVPASGLYQKEAVELLRAVKAMAGGDIPIQKDDSPAGAVPIVGNLILLGNRSTNRAIEQLYNQYYCLTDLKYPGPEGYEVRTLHNPFGNKRNVIIVGASDAVGIGAGTQALIGKLNGIRAGKGNLSVGWMMDIKLGKGIVVSKDLRSFATWEDSAGYGSTGYFGWNSISKRMAMYYMTGDPFHAREAMRLAFPDKQAFQEICDIDDERIENKDDPLAGPYHYNAHMMILFWDLVEESPVFSDEERLKVTNAFSRQLDHRKNEGIYTLVSAPPTVGSRHGQWSAVSLYCLGRYFQKDYPNPVWEQCVRGAKLHFAPLRAHAWIAGESDNLFWYNTGIAPIFTYLMLSGDREPVENGVLAELLRGQEILISGRRPDWALRYASMDYLHKAADLTKDGRYLTYRDRTGVDLSLFRLGQSYWPDDSLKPALPTDLVGKWTVNGLSVTQWRARGNGLPLEESFMNASFRNTTDDSGDYILLDGFNGASRNPYHTFDILELRIDGKTLLQGYRNHLLVKVDGMVEPPVAMDGALRYKNALGQTAIAVGEVPRTPFCNWRRSLIQRVSQYALVADDLTFRTDSENVEVQLQWENTNGRMQVDPENDAVLPGGAAKEILPAGWLRFRSLDATCTTNLKEADAIARLDGLDITLLRAKEPGAWMEMPFELKEKVIGQAVVDFLDYADRGICRISIDGKPMGDVYDNYSTAVEKGQADLGRLELAAGNHRLRVEVTQRREATDRCFIGLMGLTMRTAGAPSATPSSGAEIHTSDTFVSTVSGNVVTREWNGAARMDQHKMFFSLIGVKPEYAGSDLRCLRIADNAAALALPQRAVVCTGEWEKTKGDLVILAEDHLSGKGVLSAGIDKPLIASDTPVDADWDFKSGVLVAQATKDSRLRVTAGKSGTLRMDGKPLKTTLDAAGIASIDIPEGKHVLEGFQPDAATLASLAAGLQTLAAQAEKNRAKGTTATAPPTASSSAQPISPAFSATVGGSVADLITFTDGKARFIAAAAEKSVYLFDDSGKLQREMKTDGSIRLIHWWAEHQLLLAGCVDEKIIAFDLVGNRKWVFVSEMDPAVFRAAKTYWFKSAPGHGGIHGLDTGTFLDGKSQAFVGSACTLEIIDENGKLVKRMPQFWGTVYQFALIPGPDGSVNLLASRKITDGSTCGVINSKTLDPTPRNFYAVPAGHSFVPGWMSQTRHHIFHADLDADGKQEVVSEITGSWNRVTVWDEQGTTLSNVQFGPGDSFPVRSIRDIDIGDINGDGKQEILVGLSSGIVLALDHKCEKIWARRLPSPPTALQAVGRSVLVGSQDGSVTVLDSTGDTTGSGKVEGQPTCITLAGNAVVLATSKGQIAAYNASP